MTKNEFYRLMGKLDAGGVATESEVIALAGFAEGLVDFIQAIEEEGDGDTFGTEGWEHAIGWD